MRNSNLRIGGLLLVLLHLGQKFASILLRGGPHFMLVWRYTLVVRFIVELCSSPYQPVCHPGYFVAGLGRISTLSADAATQLGPPNLAGLYKPENGGQLEGAR